jgi:hypothetical protein
MVSTANSIYRNYAVDGVVSSGAHEPRKAEIRAWGSWVEGIIAAFTANGGLIYSSLALLNADLAHAANSMAWVIGDPVAANNGVYGKVGTSGVGSWTRRSDLPYSFIIANDSGAGTPNAIQLTTNIPVSDGVIVSFVLSDDTTAAPVTVSINGGTALTLKTNRGNNASALTAGMDIWFRTRSSDNTARMLNDQDVSALVEAAADEFVAATQSYRDEAAASAADSLTSANDSAASATEAQMYADMVGASVFDFNVDSDPLTPGYDWNT